MKMEHTLTAPRDGKISVVSAAAGMQATDGAILVRLEALPEQVAAIIAAPPQSRPA
jgi:3-methylcrotonyl-CoA carboxylase alpha subunit